MSVTQSNGYVPLYQLTRGTTVESTHFGAIAVSNVQGNCLAWAGNPETVTFLRSSAKPFQALPFVERGGVEHFGITPQELALICSSHSGTDQHVNVVSRLQQKIGIAETNLQCGVHPAYHPATAEAMRARGEAPTPYRHNCSGKHTGMLAHAILRNLPLDTYLRLEHPVQQSILQAMAEMASLPESQIALGTDGCSAPNFGMPLVHAALAFARLSDPAKLTEERAAACRKIVQAMTAFPDMVGGPDRFDTRLMQVAGGQILAKGGAEGYQAIGVLPDAIKSGSPALGITLKISDGDGKGRARSAVTLAVLDQLGVLSQPQMEALADFGPVLPVYNWRKLVVGEARPCFELVRV